ncbi:hypothetical protein GCM10007877_28260 [Marinibactrum halimedae]|uniref:Tetratricopeptide repeat protein n=2 Tax=Marinibactrum halimedae TaxID=1444977 RepID=A0AA37T919_9GAMM|nr:hypothetical protein GCM10007877_28260 [Marinibactrum halimedae]
MVLRWTSVALFAASIASSSLAKEQPLTSVADLRYGVALYHYFQDDYFSSLSELMVAEEEGGIHGHGDNPELIEGGISLAFGMYDQAEATFTRLLTEDRSEAVRNTAWFYLAKLAYLRGEWAKAKASLDRLMVESLSSEMAAEQQVMRINIDLRAGSVQNAISALEESENLGIWENYAQFNIASSLSRENQHTVAVPYYQAIYQEPLLEDAQVPDEQLALRDKAHTAAGYSFLASENWQEALNEFRQVRLDTTFSTKALLGYGWAAFSQENYSEAITPWQELLRRDHQLSEVQEAMIALPYAYEKMGAPGDALQQYLNAETAFEKELDRITSAVQVLGNANLLPLLKIDIDKNSSWLNEEEVLRAPIINYLQVLVSQNQFNNDLQELRDLYALRQQLALWQDKLDHYDHLIAAKSVARKTQVQKIQDQAFVEKISQLEAERDAVSAEIERIKSEKDYLALALNDRQELVDRVKQTTAAIEKLGSKVNTENVAKQKLLAGILFWESSEKYHTLLWDLEQRQAQLIQDLNALSGNYEHLQAVIRNAPDVVPQRAKIAAHLAKLQAQVQTLDAGIASAEQNLKEKMFAQLEFQRKRVNYYQGETRLAIARLYDTTTQMEPDPISNEATIKPVQSGNGTRPLGGSARIGGESPAIESSQNSTSSPQSNSVAEPDATEITDDLVGDDDIGEDEL